MTLASFSMMVPLEPPSGNHYKKPRVFVGGISWYHTRPAKDWFAAVARVSSNMTVEGKAHEVEYTVYQGHGSRGDVDNYAKCILDALVRAGVLKSDATVVDLICHKRRDRANPRTEIIVRSI